MYGMYLFLFFLFEQRTWDVSRTATSFHFLLSSAFSACGPLRRRLRREQRDSLELYVCRRVPLPGPNEFSRRTVALLCKVVETLSSSTRGRRRRRDMRCGRKGGADLPVRYERGEINQLPRPTAGGCTFLYNIACGCCNEQSFRQFLCSDAS